MIYLVPVAIATVARLSARLPLPLRFAARDAARHRTRTVPAIAAVGATVAGVVALGIAVSSQADYDEKTYQPMLPIGYGAVAVPSDATAADVAQLEQILSKGLPDAPRVPVTGVVTDTDTYSLMVSFAQGDTDIQASYWGVLGTGYVVADSLPAYLGVDTDSTAAADRALASGGIVLLHSEVSSAVPSGGQVTVTVGETPPAGGEVKTRATGAFPLVAAEISGRAQPAAAVFSPAAARRLHLPTATTAIAVLPTIDPVAAQRVDEELAATPSRASLSVERGFRPTSATRIIKLVLAVLGAVLMLGGTLTATFLALSDARPDLATMAAVGARPRTRRGVAAAYALVVGLVGALLGAPIGFIPGVAISGPLTHDAETGTTSLVIPWALLGAVVLGLPLLTSLVVGACARSRLPLVARMD
jgi:putative ABC transport system permease protein